MITLKNSLKRCQAHLHPFEKTHHYTIISPIFVKKAGPNYVNNVPFDSKFS